MPTDQHKPPAHYPRLFHNALAFRGEGWGFEIARGDEAACKSEARRFRAFVGSCQQYPLSAGFKNLQQVVARTACKELPSGEWVCLIVVKKKLWLADRIKEATGE